MMLELQTDYCNSPMSAKREVTRGHSLKLAAQQSRLEIHHNSFAIRVVRPKPWNALPEDVVMASNVKVFESRLDKCWNYQPMKFNHKEYS